jgi:hypothetical protein
VRSLLTILMWAGPMTISRLFPSSARSVTARAKVSRMDSVTSLSREQEAAMGTGLQKIMLKPFW